MRTYEDCDYCQHVNVVFSKFPCNDCNDLSRFKLSLLGEEIKKLETQVKRLLKKLADKNKPTKKEETI